MLATLLDNVYAEFTNLLLVVIVGLGAEILRRIQKMQARRKVKEHQLQFATEIDGRIKELITECRVKFDAERCYLSQFHNGDYTVGDNPILRKTRTHESVKEGRSYQSELFKGMLVSNVTEEIKLVLDDGPSFTKVAQIPTGKFKWMCQEAGIEAIARCAVRKDGKVIGFVGLDFDHTVEPEEIYLLCEYAGRIESII